MYTQHDLHPHDLLWVARDDALIIDGPLPAWFHRQRAATYPVVVRREAVAAEFVAVGIRGQNRSQRLAAKVHCAEVIARLTPEEVLLKSISKISQSSSLPAMQALDCLMDIDLTWIWGVTGSAGYQLASDVQVMNDNSDLDLVFRSPVERDFDQFVQLSQCLSRLPGRIDAQIETPNGAFALNEWVRDRQTMLKTVHGPIMTTNPWQ
ncbi:phosphoribosyl-dephospho-CoA transferase [Orbus hercynius]|uniref:Phosphoribosyl-dephospho-CoA transferase n=1 Tax=Orbus hercynius TaxID=593135 RepID=A0A495RB25_9GAMM|nr:malonate decarboxylase holo-ACP synthase [Orbus hercynius]RKS84460.1 phosphoribosyl-dephospho-CoA transferase [Orbus hercynius]